MPGPAVWESVRQDLWYAVRAARRSRGFAAGVVLILALGIAANTAVFSVVNAVLIEPLPYPEPDRIVQIVSESPAESSTLASIPRFTMWRDATNAFQHIAAWHTGGPGINLTLGDRPEHLAAINASSDYFRLFGAGVLAGRTFSAEEDRPAGPRVVVIGHGLWKRRFGGDPSVLGRTIPLGGVPHEIIGVLDQRFVPDRQTDVWLPLQADPFSVDHTRFLQVAARLKPGVDVHTARLQIARTLPPFRQMYPFGVGRYEAFAVKPLRDVVVGDLRPGLQLITGAVAFVLLIACANAASLLLARANRRRAEFATRAALGARRSRLVRQLLCDSFVLTLAGGALGLLLGRAGVLALAAWRPFLIPRLTPDLPLDWRVVGFTTAISAFTGIAFGLLPALSGSRVDLSSAFKRGGENATPAGHRRLHAVLVVAEMTLALVLLVGAGLMIRTFIAQRTFDRGFDSTNVVALDMALGQEHQTTRRIAELIENVRLRLQDRGNVAAIATTRALPVDEHPEIPFTIVDRPLFGGDVAGPYHGAAAVQNVSSEYFNVFQMKVTRGRAFNRQDREGAPKVAIINESMARHYWESPRLVKLNEQIAIGSSMGRAFADSPRRIVGIVADVRDPVTGRWPGPVIYLPEQQATDAMTAWNNRLHPLTWVVRTSVDPHLVTSLLAEELRGAAAGVPIARMRTMGEVLAATTAQSHFAMMLFTGFAVLALVLAAIGMYALMAYSVQQRTREIGIRIAFGASPAAVRNSVVAQSARLAAVGVIFGVGAALALSRLMASLVFGIDTWDPAVFASVAAILTIVALAAAYVPALRATRVSPLDTFRM